MIFTVFGQPAAQPRPKFSRQGGFVRAYDPAQAISYKAQVLAEWRAGTEDRKPIAEGPISVTIDAFFLRPKSRTRKRPPLPQDEPMPWGKDCDNIAKIILDALNGWAWRDDCQVTTLTVRKWMAAQDAGPRVRVEYEAL